MESPQETQKEMHTKHSAIDLTELAFGVVVLGIAVAIGAVVLINIRNSQISSLPSGTIVNETVTTVNTLGDPLAFQWVNSVIRVTNGSQTVPSSNYTLTVDPNTGQGTFAMVQNAGQYNNTNLNVTYSIYNTSDPRYTLPDSATTGLAEYGNWFKIIVIVGVAAVVLSLIFMAFGNKGNSGSAVSY